MNTKMLFLLIVSLFFANNQFSIATSNEKSAETTVTISHQKSSKPDAPSEEMPPVDLGMPRSFQKTLTPNSDDDGKHHHFHFDRITCIGNRRFILLMLSKLILIISQVCCFIYCVTHTFH